RSGQARLKQTEDSCRPPGLFPTLGAIQSLMRFGLWLLRPANLSTSATYCRDVTIITKDKKPVDVDMSY
ncbi:hypothetical protein L195_g042729, partial [Trifolium pratense]